jgi:hypothetical protein
MLDYFNFFTQHTDYGSSRTRSFADIFPDFETFQSAWSDTIFSQQAVALSQEIPETATDKDVEGPQNLKLIYELLLSRYANSTIASSDENRFVLQCMATIFQYAPAWIKRLEIQHTLHEMDLDSEEFLRGSAVISNISLNPSEDPGTDTMTALSTINQQNTNIQKRDKFKALAILEELLKTDITGAFLDKFRSLFRTIVAPQRPLFYTTEETN